MSVETNACSQQPIRHDIGSGMEFVRPETVVTPEQRNGLVAWIEDNQEYATAIAEALDTDEEYAAVFSMFADDKELRAHFLPNLLDAIEKHLDPTTQTAAEVAPVETIVEGPNRWTKVREKIVEAYVKLDAGLADDAEIDTPAVHSWGAKTWREIEDQVVNDPRKTIRFANRPELRMVVAQPSRFEEFVDTNKVAAGTLEFIGKKVEKPLLKFDDQSKRLNEFLDDSRPLEDIALDSAAIVANAMIDGFSKLQKYDEKLIAATCRMIVAMNIPGNYAKVRQYEDAMTEKLADKIIATVTEYDYKNALQVVGNAVKPETRRTRAAVAAGVVMGWAALSGAAVDTDTPVRPQENRIESVVPAAIPELTEADRQSVVLITPTSFNLNSK